MIEKTRSIEAVFMEKILTGIATVEITSNVWMLTSIASESFSWIHNGFQDVWMAEVLFTLTCPFLPSHFFSYC